MGLVGTGFGERVILPALRAVPRFEPAAICASTDARAASASARTGIARSYGDWSRLVADPEIDAVVIAVPPSLQPEIALAAMKRGKHVFCEKPLGVDARRARRMADLAHEKGVANLVDFELCEIPAWRRAREILRKGGIGTLRQASVSWQIETYAIKMGLDTWKHADESGGGVSYQFASHVLHYLEWFLGPAKRLSARSYAAPGKPERGKTLAHYSFEFASGAAGAAVIGTDAFLGSGHRIEFYGDKGALVLENAGPDHAAGFRLRYGTRASGNYLADVAVNEPKVSGDGRIPLVASMLSRWARWIERGEKTGPTLADGARVQELLEAVDESDDKKAWVSCA